MRHVPGVHRVRHMMVRMAGPAAANAVRRIAALRMRQRRHLAAAHNQAAALRIALCHQAALVQAAAVVIAAATGHLARMAADNAAADAQVMRGVPVVAVTVNQLSYF